MGRNNISVRKPETTRIGRSVRFNKEEVNRFLVSDTEETIDKYKFEDTNNWNVDEIGITTLHDQLN